jgi:hypothetical protein
MGLALVIAGCLIVGFEARHLVFSGDDWTFILDRRAWDLDTFLTPHNEHLSALPVLAYKLLLETFGAGSYAPFMVLALLVHGLACLALFVLARDRVGPWAALAPTAVLVLLGPAWHDLLWAFQVGYLGSVAAGLWAVVCLERGRDAAAAGLVLVALACSSLGLAMAVLAAVSAGLGRRLWVAAAPLALYGAWYVAYGTSAVRGENVDGIPRYVARALAAALASVTGLADGAPSPYLVSTTYGRYLAVAAVLALAWLVVRRRGLPTLALAALAAAGALWTAEALAYFPNGREAAQSRYQYAAAALLLLAATALADGWRPTRRTGAVLAAVTTAVVVSNVHLLHERADFWTANSEYVAAETGAIELARDVVDPTFVPEDAFTAPVIGVHNLPIVAGPYLSAAAAYGSVADTPRELAQRSEPVREATDFVLARALGLRASAGSARCQAATDTPVPPGGAITGGTIELRRFADRYRFVRYEGAERIRLPRDRAALPWRARVTCP